MILSVLASVVFGSWWIIFSIIPFSLLEALFVIAYKRCRPSIGILIFPAWITKNIAWSVGIGNGILSLLIHPETRHRLRSKRAGCR
jgi:hypothetical protein